MLDSLSASLCEPKRSRIRAEKYSHSQLNLLILCARNPVFFRDRTLSANPKERIAHLDRSRIRPFSFVFVASSRHPGRDAGCQNMSRVAGNIALGMGTSNPGVLFTSGLRGTGHNIQHIFPGYNSLQFSEEEQNQTDRKRARKSNKGNRMKTQHFASVLSRTCVLF